MNAAALANVASGPADGPPAAEEAAVAYTLSSASSSSTLKEMTGRGKFATSVLNPLMRLSSLDFVLKEDKEEGVSLAIHLV